MNLNESDENFLKELGLKLRRIRKARGWTLEYTEEEGWPDWKYLQRIESGKNVTIITLRHIAQLYGLSLVDIIPNED